METQSSHVRRAARMARTAAAVLTLCAMVSWAAPDPGLQLTARAKKDVLKEMVRTGARPASHLPKMLLAPCMDGWTRPSGVSYSQFAEAEIVLTNAVSLRRLRSYPLAPGSQVRLGIADVGGRSWVVSAARR
jgi:hypothetical protein